MRMYLALILLTVSNAHAEALSKDEVLVRVHGVVCSFCAYGVAKGLAKLDFVDQSRFKRGVKMDIENQKILVAVKGEPSLQKIFEVVKDAGYEPISAHTKDALGNEVVKEWK